MTTLAEIRAEPELLGSGVTSDDVAMFAAAVWEVAVERHLSEEEAVAYVTRAHGRETDGCN